MKEVIKLYRLFNLLSLDVAVGAVVGTLFFARIYGVTSSFTSLISLGLSVWIIYTTDRLLDVQDLKSEAASERHRFHQQNQKKLSYWLLMIIIADAVLIFFMPVTIINHGIFLSLVVLIYIFFRRKLNLFKEFLVAALYTAGVLLPAWPENLIRFDQYLPMLLFFLIALINLIIFSWYEKENDLKDRQNSIATLVVETIIRYILICLFVITFSISFYLFFQPAFHFISLVFLAMTAVLFLLFKYKKLFASNDYYRIAGDAVFLFPIVYLLA